MMTLKQVETVEQLAKTLSLDSVSNALYLLLREIESLQSRVQDLEKDKARLQAKLSNLEHQVAKDWCLKNLRAIQH